MYRQCHWVQEVLILIFLENALRQLITLIGSVELVSLNPYFFGKCSTAFSGGEGLLGHEVLILIFLENALRPYRKE